MKMKNLQFKNQKRSEKNRPMIKEVSNCLKRFVWHLKYIFYSCAEKLGFLEYDVIKKSEKDEITEIDTRRRTLITKKDFSIEILFEGVYEYFYYRSFFRNIKTKKEVFKIEEHESKILRVEGEGVLKKILINVNGDGYWIDYDNSNTQTIRTFENTSIFNADPKEKKTKHITEVNIDLRDTRLRTRGNIQEYGSPYKIKDAITSIENSITAEFIRNIREIREKIYNQSNLDSKSI